jgi:hypothetical protein
LFHSIPVLPDFFNFLIAYDKAKLKSNGDKASPFFQTILNINASNRFLTVQTLVLDSFKHIAKAGRWIELAQDAIEWLAT